MLELGLGCCKHVMCVIYYISICMYVLLELPCCTDVCVMCYIIYIYTHTYMYIYITASPPPPQTLKAPELRLGGLPPPPTQRHPSPPYPCWPDPSGLTMLAASLCPSHLCRPWVSVKPSSCASIARPCARDGCPWCRCAHMVKYVYLTRHASLVHGPQHMTPSFTQTHTLPHHPVHACTLRA